MMALRQINMDYPGKGEIKRSPEKIKNMGEMGESGKREGEHEGMGWLS